MKDYYELKLRSNIQYEGKFFNVCKDDVVLPNDNKSKREFLSYPESVIIIPKFENGDTLLIHQYRYPVKEHLWEFPAGKLTADEDKALGAAREFKEETGYRAEHIHLMGDYYPSPGYSSEHMYLHIAEGLHYEGQNLDPDEFIQVKRLPIIEAMEMIKTGEIKDIKTISALFLAQTKWSQL